LTGIIIRDEVHPLDDQDDSASSPASGLTHEEVGNFFVILTIKQLAQVK
jgi:hypothetical protein